VQRWKGKLALITKAALAGVPKGGSFSCTTAHSFAAHALYKALALSGLVLMTTLLSTAPPARAGDFNFASSTYAPSVTPDANSGTPQAGGNHYLFGSCADSASTGNGAVSTAKMSVTITLRGVWTHDAGQTDATDPAPPGVCLEETGTAGWSGVTHTNTAPTGSCSNPLKGGDVEFASTNPIGGTRSGHQFTNLTASGGVVTLTRTFSGTASAPSVTQNWSSAQAGLSSYQVTVHAQPYNFRQAMGQDNHNGTLTFSYTWLSTDGDVSHLTSCVVYEHVTYQGAHGTSANPVPYQPSFPPWDMAWSSPPNGLHDPTELPNPKLPATNVNPAAGIGLGDGQNIVGGFLLPANNTDSVSSSFIATQNYWFDDSATNEQMLQIPGPDSGPISIVRTVHNNYNPATGYPTPFGYVYTVIKNGVSGQKVLTP